jgi:malate dehydrogenase (oxaloacetate-decarboxylating)(NADP+)
LATMRLLLTLGADLNHIFVLDSQGVIHTERTDLNVYKQRFAHQTPHRTLADVMQDADVFIGVSGPNLLAPELLETMAARPIVFALSNPDPEIRPEQALIIRQDLIMATGRSDYPNQVNNVVCFPYLFRGALDVRAHTINDAMLTAAVHAIASIAREPVPPAILAAYGLTALAFGAQYILPKPMDPRLLERVPAAVSAAAIASGVTRK